MRGFPNCAFAPNAVSYRASRQLQRANLAIGYSPRTLACRKPWKSVNGVVVFNADAMYCSLGVGFIFETRRHRDAIPFGARFERGGLEAAIIPLRAWDRQRVPVPRTSKMPGFAVRFQDVCLGVWNVCRRSGLGGRSALIQIFGGTVLSLNLRPPNLGS